MDDNELFKYILNNFNKNQLNELSNLLINNLNIEINYQNEDGYTALMVMSYHNNSEMVKLLLNRRANINLINEQGNNALMTACYKNNVESVKLLLNTNLPINIKNKNDESALVIATQYNNLDVVKLLLEKNAYIDYNNDDITSFVNEVFFDKNQEMLKSIINVKPNKLIEMLNSSQYLLLLNTELIETLTSKSVLILEILRSLLESYQLPAFALSQISTHNLIGYKSARQLEIKVKSQGKALIGNPEYILNDLNQSVRDRLGLWHTLLDANTNIDFCRNTLDRLEIIKEIADHKTSKQLKELAYLKDILGRRAIDLTISTIKCFIYQRIYFLSKYEISDNEKPFHQTATSLVVKAIDHTIIQMYSEIYDSSNNHTYIELLPIVMDMLCIDLTSYDFSKLPPPEISREDFIKYCIYAFGETRLVVIKFMNKKEEYQHELEIRRHIDSNEYIMPIIESFDLDYQIDESNIHPNDTNEYIRSYGFVMPGADRNLLDIHHKENLHFDAIRRYLLDIVKCIQYLHNNVKIVHGDLKLSNIVRINNQLKLIDFDGSAVIPDHEIDRSNYTSINYIGLKYSSGDLPPEMFHILTNQQVDSYNNYWNIKTNQSDLVVKSFQTNRLHGLPYDLVVAHPSVDIWSFGVLMYRMLAKRPLLNVTDRNDLTVESLHQMKSMIMISSKNKIMFEDLVANSKLDENAVDLLHQIFTDNPTNRLTIDQIAGHKFFNQSLHNDMMNSSTKNAHILKNIEEQLVSLHTIVKNIQSSVIRIDQTVTRTEAVTKDLFLQLKKTEDVLMRGIYEANEVTIPTCFILLNHKLVFDNDKIVNNTSPIDKSLDLFTNLLDTGNNILHNKVDIQKFIRDRLFGEKLYLYLIDELTMTPVVGDNYPIAINEPSNFILKFMPFINTSMKAIQLVNGIAGFVHCLGFTTNIISDIVNKANSLIEKLKYSISYEDFYKLQHHTYDLFSDEAKSEINTLRGPALKDFEKFIISFDTKKLFCGLKRVHTLEGVACWTRNERDLSNGLMKPVYDDNWLKSTDTLNNTLNVMTADTNDICHMCVLS